jgi:RND family efflux transporter MFP subunit
MTNGSKRTNASNPESRLTLDKPEEERLLEEIESLRRELEEEKKRGDSQQEYKPNRRSLRWIGVPILAVVILALLGGLIPHLIHERELKREAQEKQSDLPEVNYIVAMRSPATAELVLPGNMEALTEAPILARADGYLRTRKVDIGDRVQAGQLMAEIEAPELDQQVEQARAQVPQAQAAENQAVANLNQGRANLALTHVTALRWAELLVKGAVSRQENDQYQAADQAQAATVKALEEVLAAAQQNTMAANANVNRLIGLQSYEQVRAPFSGVVTLRNVDVGALIESNSPLLFRIAQIDRLRVYIYVPETDAPGVQIGQRASLRVMEFPRHEFAGSITGTSDSLDPTSRTLLTEVQVPNPEGALLPGMHAGVRLNTRRDQPPVLVPGSAVIMLPNKSEIATLQDSDSKNQIFQVQMEPVTLGRDYGAVIEILSGLNGGERVVSNPNDDVRQGARLKGKLSDR